MWIAPFFIGILRAWYTVVVGELSLEVTMKSYDKDELAEASKLEFKITDRIASHERFGRKLTMASSE